MGYILLLQYSNQFIGGDMIAHYNDEEALLALLVALRDRCGGKPIMHCSAHHSLMAGLDARVPKEGAKLEFMYVYAPTTRMVLPKGFQPRQIYENEVLKTHPEDQAILRKAEREAFRAAVRRIAEQLEQKRHAQVLLVGTDDLGLAQFLLEEGGADFVTWGHNLPAHTHFAHIHRLWRRI